METAKSENGSENRKRPNPEIVVRGQRRQFSASYKWRIVQEADQCQQPGEVGALLRREGLYASQLSDWRRERERGQLTAPGTAKSKPATDESNRWRLENAQLKAQVAQAELIIAAQKKLAQALEQALLPNKGTLW